VFPKADRYLIAITLIWGSTFSVTKVILEDMPPLMLQGVRFALAALMVGIYTRRDIRATNRASLKAGIILGLMLGGGFALQTVGLVQTTASKAGFLTGTMVIFTPMLQLAIERRLPTIANLIGVLVVAVGMYLFTMPGAGDFNSGDMLVLFCAVVFAFYIVYLDVFTKEKFHREIVFYQFVVTSIMGFAGALLLGDASTHISGDALLGLLYLALFASSIAIFVQSKYQRESTPTKAAIIFSLEPVFAALMAWMILDERMSALEATGAAIMFLGLLVSEIGSALRFGKQREHPADS